MTEPFEFFEHTADIGVRVTGATLPELFTNAARAMDAALGELQKSVELRAETLEDLLHNWLPELLFEIEARQMFYDRFAVTVEPGWLTATMRGGRIDFARSGLRQEIKAVTYHQLRVEQMLDGAWQATIIFDV